MVSGVERVVERVADFGLPWRHAAHRDRSHRATTERLLPGSRIRGHRSADRPTAAASADGEDRGAGPDPAGPAAGAGGHRAAAGVRRHPCRLAGAVHGGRRARPIHSGNLRGLYPAHDPAALGEMELRKLRGPVLDTLYARLRRCGNLACTGRPFTEHRYFPVLAIDGGDRRRAWQQVAEAIREAIGAGQLASGEQLGRGPPVAIVPVPPRLPGRGWPSGGVRVRRRGVPEPTRHAGWPAARGR